MKSLKFSAIWCPSCLIMHSRYSVIENKYSIPVTEYDYDFDEEMVNKYNIGNVLPVYILLDNNDNEIIRIIGEKTEKELDEIISKIEE